jgi:hypothetical protein
MSRVEAASGARYSAHKEQPRKFEPIAPVGTNYTPVGKVDIDALRKVPAPPASTRPAFSASKPASSAGPPSGRTVIGGSAPSDAWPEEKSTISPPPLPAASRPPVLSTSSRPAFSANVGYLGLLLSLSEFVCFVEGAISSFCTRTTICRACLERAYQAIRGGPHWTRWHRIHPRLTSAPEETQESFCRI